MRCSLLENGVFFYPEKDKSSKDKPCCNFGTYTQSNSLHKIKITEII